jgi:small ligand-binding sensory domain FIST
MKWASAISSDASFSAALEALLTDLSARVTSLDLLVVFVSPHHLPAWHKLPAEVSARFPKTTLLGCSGGGIIGAGREIEDRPALAMIAAELPNVSITPFHLEAVDLPAPDADRTEWEHVLGLKNPPADPHFIVLPDPFSFDAGAFLRGLDEHFPASKKIGGLVSGGAMAGGNILFAGNKAHRGGIAGVVLDGDLVVETIVAQGCRPIGEPMLITRCAENVIYELGSKPPLEVLQNLAQTISARDRRLMQHSLFLGIEMKDQREYHAGDFLVRNIVGVDPKNGAMAVGALPQPWQAAQFHLRDADTSAEDLARLLDRHKSGGASPEGALLFSCLGRGQHLYGRPDHDSGLFMERFDAPIAGFFCNGEIGPVGKTTFLHGYTSAFALFRAKSAAGSKSGGV